MENLSRVIKYEEWRKKIENSEFFSDVELNSNENESFDGFNDGTYSNVGNQDLDKTLILDRNVRQSVELFDYEHIKKNTLSMSLDEISAQKKKDNSFIDYSKSRKKKIFNESKDIESFSSNVVKTRKRNYIFLSKRNIALICSLVLILILILIIILLIVGVI